MHRKKDNPNFKNGRRRGQVNRFQETGDGIVHIETDLPGTFSDETGTFSGKSTFSCRLKNTGNGNGRGQSKGNPKNCIEGDLTILTVEVDDEDGHPSAQDQGQARGKLKAAIITDSGTGMTYDVRVDGTVIETHASDFPDEDEPVDQPPLPPRNLLRNSGQPEVKTHDETGRRLSFGDDGSIVDILVLWTDAMQAAAGSATQAQADVLNGINSFNTAAENSGVLTRLNLVYSAKDHTGYEEGGSTGDCLTDIRGTSDGKLDYVHDLRNQYGADMVALVTSVSCGTAYLGPNNGAYMFSVTGR